MHKNILVVLLLFSTTFGISQLNKLRINLDESGETYIKANFRAQFWTRYIDMNPGTTYSEDFVDQRIDFSIRRIRAGVQTQLTPKLFFYTLIGGNNLNNSSEKSWPFKVLDLNVEYTLSEELAIGMGKTGWDGLSRHLVRSNKTLMTLDAPIFSLLTVNKDDDVGRNMGIWIKGQIGKFDYIATLKEPAFYGEEAQEGIVDFANGNKKMRTSGYVKYEFLDNESNKTAYSGAAGTRLGQQRLLNIGAGFLYQPEMTSSLVNGVEQRYDFKNWAAEIFYDVPTGTDKNSSITTYLGYFNTDFGPGYVRNVGANDYTSGGTSFNGSGNDFPMIGTGSTVFFQFGHAFAAKTKTELIQVQPNFAIQRSDFDGLDDIMWLYDVGVNLFFDRHNNKLSLGYQNRPIYNTNTSGEIKVTERKGMVVLQYQLEIN